MTDERQDDEVLGRALARAIETQDEHETPYERSRIAMRRLRGGFPFAQFAGAAATLVLVALAFASWLTRPNEAPSVAASTTPSPVASVQTLAPSASALPTIDLLIFVADPNTGLPRVRTSHLTVAAPPTDSADRTKLRLQALGALYPESGVAATAIVKSVAISGDIVTVEYDTAWTFRDVWKGFSSAQALRAVREIVYTATEEPIIRRVLIRENGGNAMIGPLVLDKPLSREDVSPYSVDAAQPDSGQSAIADPGTGDVPASQLRLSTTLSVDSVSPGLARFVIQLDRTTGALPSGFAPRFVATRPRLDAVMAGFTPPDMPGEASIWVEIDGADAKVGLETIDSSPLRSIWTTSSNGRTTYRLKIDAAYPWRAFTLSGPTRLVVEIGGDPRLVSDRIALTQPVFDAKVSPSFVLSGSARVFEANIVWRVKDSTQKVVASGHTTASLGTSALWGTFETTVTLPSSVTIGRLMLEVYEASPKDGSEQGLVAVPINR